MQSAYLCVIFRVKHKKLPPLAVLTLFLNLGKIEDEREEDRKNSVKIQTLSKTLGRGSIHHPSPPPVGGMNLCMSLRPRVKPEVKEVDASRNKREFQNFALVCRVLMFIFASLIKFSDNLRDLFSIICAPISRYTLD